MTIPNFLGIFESRLSKLKKSIEKELHKPKKERNKKFLKDCVREARDMRNKLRIAKRETAKRCPHCNEIL